ncbi:MAG TPA: adenylyl-sulfate kinase [Candidatus Angelobacter sp.]|nr:adenylyl-sulfate kinase [Candidatus Angelobacter sp.]
MHPSRFILEVTGVIYWFTGQPGSGKTTLAMALKVALQKAGHPVIHLDGEFLRELMANRDFSETGRIRNIRAGQQLAMKLHDEGIVVVASFVSPYREMREEFKKRSRVLEIYVHTTEVRGRENHFAVGFEPPSQDFLDLDTTGVSVEACIQKILHAKRA